MQSAAGLGGGKIVPMNSPRYVHLRLHSEYSVTDGIVRVGDAVKRAAGDGMPALALTDLGNLFGLVKFYTGARGKGVKPIAGVDVWITNPEAPEDACRLLLLARNRTGYRQLCELFTRAYLVEGRRDRAEIRREWFGEIGSDGLIALSGAHLGDVGQALINGNFDLAGERAKAWEAIFPGAFYLELQRYGQPQQEAIVQQTADLAGELGLPVVATHPIQFMNRDDFRAHEARVCIAEGYVLGDKRRPKRFTEQQYFKTQAEMAELFADLPEALANSVEIAKRCNIELTLGKSNLPHFPIPDGMTMDEYLVAEAEDGLESAWRSFSRTRKSAEAPPGIRRPARVRVQHHHPDGLPRLLPDRGRLHQLGQAQWRAGRAGAGFRRGFAGRLQPGHHRPRSACAMPCCSSASSTRNGCRCPTSTSISARTTAGKVIEYVRQQYGAHAVSQIVTFGTMAAKAVMRDVGRVLDLPYTFCDRISKLIPLAQGKRYRWTRRWSRSRRSRK